MKATLIVFSFFVSSLLHAQRTAAQISEALHREIIPHLELKEVSAEEALATVRRQWERANPKDPFPVGLVDFDGAVEARKARITLVLNNVPYLEAIKYIANLSNRQLFDRRGAVGLKALASIEEDWSTTEWPITPAVIEGLGLRAKSSGDEVRAAFKKLGVEFEGWMTAALASDGKNGHVLFVTCYERQRYEIAGIILLLKNGFKITR